MTEDLPAGRTAINPNAWDAGYADGLAGRSHRTNPLHQVYSAAYSAGFIDGRAAARIGWIPDVPCDYAGRPLPDPIIDSDDV